MVNSDLGDIIILAVESIAANEVEVNIVDALWEEDIYSFYVSGCGHRAAIVKQPDGSLVLVVERS